jgi:hypothetical protein
MVEVDGVHIAYERVGSGPALVLLHGYVGDGPTTWRRRRQLDVGARSSRGTRRGPVARAIRRFFTAPAGKVAYWEANVVRELADEAVDARLEHGPKLRRVEVCARTLRTLRAARGQGILQGNLVAPATNEPRTDVPEPPPELPPLEPEGPPEEEPEPDEAPEPPWEPEEEPVPA